VNKDTIVQFVCFTSVLEPGEFMEMWGPYAQLLVNDPSKIHLQAGIAESNGIRFNYVSQHKCSAADFSFAFMKGKGRADFPEHKARIKQAGGYSPVQVQSPDNIVKGDVKVIAFVAQGDSDLDFYRGQTYRHLNIYEAYFENCAYGYVMEFFLQKQQAPELLTQLRARTGVEAALYKTCSHSQSPKRVSSSLS
jgi:hypothetical protein